MINFGKKISCPTSQKMLAFQDGKTSEKESQTLRRHLAECDFCAAEVEIYAHFPQAEENIEPPMIPPPLYELAEALLSNRRGDFFLGLLIHENESLRLENV